MSLRVRPGLRSSWTAWLLTDRYERHRYLITCSGPAPGQPLAALLCVPAFELHNRLAATSQPYHNIW